MSRLLRVIVRLLGVGLGVYSLLVLWDTVTEPGDVFAPLAGLVLLLVAQPLYRTAAAVTTAAGVALRLLGLVVGLYAGLAMVTALSEKEAHSSRDTGYQLVAGVVLLAVARLLLRSAADDRQAALQARRQLGWTLLGLGAVQALLALALAVLVVVRGVPVPEDLRPLGLALASGVAILTVGRWVLRRAELADEDQEAGGELPG